MARYKDPIEFDTSLGDRVLSPFYQGHLMTEFCMKVMLRKLKHRFC